jgi:membrane protein implicated in regulation of membrane protease activity
VKIMTRLLNRDLGGRRARRVAGRTAAVVLPAAGTTSVLHFNGTSWTPETTPAGPDGSPIMIGVGAVPGSATEVWAVGFTLPSGGGYHTFAIRHP